jgi:hypothetical protein
MWLQASIVSLDRRLEPERRHERVKSILQLHTSLPFCQMNYTSAWHYATAAAKQAHPYKAEQRCHSTGNS